jgi:hypothetical protein
MFHQVPSPKSLSFTPNCIKLLWICYIKCHHKHPFSIVYILLSQIISGSVQDLVECYRGQMWRFLLVLFQLNCLNRNDRFRWSAFCVSAKTFSFFFLPVFMEWVQDSAYWFSGGMWHFLLVVPRMVRTAMTDIEGPTSPNKRHSGKTER